MTRTFSRFSIWRYSLLVVLQFGGLLLAIRLIAPKLWAEQVGAGIGPFVLVFLGMHIFCAFAEWGLHRYILHAVTARWLQRFARAHRNHHSLTKVRLRSAEIGAGRILLVDDRYPIVDQEQNESSAFPFYALALFWLLFTPLLFTVQQLLPGVPVYLGGYAALTWSTASYEVFHAVEHLPYDWWKRATEHPRFGGLWRKVYGFHHFHHANVHANEAISGFFGLPLADWVLRTYHQPRELLLHGRMATAKDFEARPSWPFVARLDKWAQRRETRILHALKNAS